jgi:hypothetical protein
MSSFEVDSAQDHTEVCGMRGATGYEGGNTPTVKRVKVGAPTPEEALAMQQKTSVPPPVQVSIPELLADTEKSLGIYEKHYQKRDCSILEMQLRNELFAQLLGHHVAAELARACAVLRAHYDKRWSHRSYLRNDAHRFASVIEARKLHGRLIAAKGPDFLPVARELLEICRISLSEPSLLRAEDIGY